MELPLGLLDLSFCAEECIGIWTGDVGVLGGC